MKKNVKVTREQKLNGDCYYCVYLNGSFNKSFYVLRHGTTDEKIRNEEATKSEATTYAMRLEAGETDIIETIYETPPQPTTDEKEN
jgi:hypothetical protein